MNHEEWFDRLITEEMDKQEIAGANVLVSARGMILFQKSYGMADREKGIPMAEDTLFRLYSMTKVVTGLAAMILLERGMLDPYDPLEKFMPEYRDMRYYAPDGKLMPAKRPLMIKDLLSMTGGLVYPGEILAAERDAAVLFDEIAAEQERGEYTDTVTFARRLARLPLAFSPGEQWHYGTSADVCGAVIELVSGMRFSEFLQKEIFDPLGMRDTGFYVPETKRQRFAQAYRHFDDGRLEILTGRHLDLEGFDAPPHFESGGAGLVSTIGDMHRLAEMLVGEGTSPAGVRIIGKETARCFRTNMLTDEQRKTMDWESLIGYGYGNFNRVLLYPGQALTNAPAGEFGWDGWLGTYLTMDVEREFIFEYFIQRADTGTQAPTRKLRSIAYGML